jgi:hypothetical protein
MGGWGYGPFDNDDAADWAYEVEESPGLGCVRLKLEEVISTVGEISAPLGSEAIAAAEILALCLGHGSSVIRPALSGWLTALNDRPTDEDLTLALAALDRVLGAESELPELWVDIPRPEDAEDWYSYMDGMRVRLQQTSDRDTYHEVERHLSETDEPRQVDWYLYFPSEPPAEEVRALLVSEGYHVDLHPPDEDATCLVVATKRIKVSYMLVMLTTNRITQIAEAHEGVLDGWGVAL